MAALLWTIAVGTLVPLVAGLALCLRDGARTRPHERRASSKLAERFLTGCCLACALGMCLGSFALR